MVTIQVKMAADAPTRTETTGIFKGQWSSVLPGAGLHDEAGAVPLFHDDRIQWLASQMGASLIGRQVLELGPLEGGHSYMLSQLGATVTAVEGNSFAYLRCLVARELLNYSNVRFLYGDFVKYLRNSTSKWDLIVASGVLYHMEDPLELLQLMASHSDQLFLWTHYYEPDLSVWNQNLLEGNESKWEFGKPFSISHDGQQAVVIRQHYLNALEADSFCGGLGETSTWMLRSDLIRVLKERGFDDIRIAFEVPDHPNGPCLALYARRSTPDSRQ